MYTAFLLDLAGAIVFYALRIYLLYTNIRMVIDKGPQQQNEL